ncbi:MAG: hypothetical protein Unbinned8454contig1000_18 [Prokaryotic dsDNA virus sp.]|nr:MAG: hypothetical protein Unbinned8454contig1000_18 [Prokaryotic dsDNA virus sp.]
MNYENKFIELQDELKGINIDLDNYCKPEDIYLLQDATDLYDLLNDHAAFGEQIIGYYKAAKYLSINDPSFHNSINWAQQRGYKVADFTSELLASVHKSQTLIHSFWNCEKEINNIIWK